MTDTEDFEDLYNNAPCGYLSVSPDGRILNANPTIARWLAYSDEAIRGKRLSDLMSIGGRIFWETHLAPLLRMQGAIEGVALDLATSDNRKIPAFASAVERRDDAGRLTVTRLALFRATDRRQYERNLVSARQAAEQAKDDLQAQGAEVQESLRLERATSELREQFIAVLGHDLRNPLAAISGTAELLSLRPSLDEAVTRNVQRIQRAAERMSALIDDVLDFARGRLGDGLPLHRTAGELLQPLLDQIVAELQVSHADRVIDAAIAVGEPITCDPRRIQQLFSNLLANALTHGAADTPIRVRASVTSGVFELSVANSGEPIPPVAMEQLFQPFFRGTVRDSRQGLGLGLYIASEIARAHAGTLEVMSSDVETCFMFRMPLT
jgi:sigma-B regulation protein RsbU (phosphoserine phosphatase)